MKASGALGTMVAPLAIHKWGAMHAGFWSLSVQLACVLSAALSVAAVAANQRSTFSVTTAFDLLLLSVFYVFRSHVGGSISRTSRMCLSDEETSSTGAGAGPSILMSAVVASRIGLWGFDLAERQIIQEGNRSQKDF